MAQIASVIGRQFGHALLAAVAGQSELELAQNLEQLVSSGLVQARGTPPDVNYLFRHALLCDTAYDSLLRTQRQDLHGRIASSIEEGFKDTAPPEILAHHLTGAGEVERAIPYWHEAGRQAVGRSANIEAINHLERAVEFLATLPDTDDRARQELEVLSSMSPALIGVKGFTVPEIRIHHERALRLADRIGEPSQKLSALFGLWIFNATNGQLDRARGITDEIGSLADESGDIGHRLQSHHAAWSLDFLSGEVEACYRETEKGLPLYDMDQHGSHALLYGGHDPGGCALNFRGVSSWVLGYPDRSKRLVEESCMLGEKLGHKMSHSVAYFFAAQTHLLRGDMALADERAGQGKQMPAELGLPYVAASANVQSLAQISVAGDREILEDLRERVILPTPGGSEPFRVYWLSATALHLGGNGQLDEAFSLFEQAGRLGENFGDCWTAPELMRHRGELLRLQDASEKEIEASFQEAIEAARSKNTKSWELRAATSLAQLKRDQGKAEEGRRILAPVYDWFTEGFDTADLKKAKSLLEEIA